MLVFHGYLLRGTGSNVYNAELAQALARAGHEVHLLCQDREAASLGWIDALGRWSGGELTVDPVPGGASPGGGSITAYLPEIGDLLPVYVEDRYAGFRVKAFPALSDAELEAYLRGNVAAVREVAARAGVEAALANHLIMGPAILARAGIGRPGGPGFAAKVHGSALSYVVRPHPRFLPHAREGMAAASGVLVGSDHVAHSLWGTLRDAELERKTRLGPPGVDTGLFAPAEPGEDPAATLEDLARGLRQADRGEGAPDDSFRRDPLAAADAVERFARARGGRVAFVGKLIASKGCELLLAAWPLIAARAPGARLAIVGFGAFGEPLERLWALLGAGRLAEAREIAARGRALEDPRREPRQLPELTAFLADPPAGYEEDARAARDSVDFTGRLEHAEVARLLRGSDALVVPSTFPEAFGMVAAEAAAAGVLPVCADHSGLAEVAGALAAELGPGLGELTAFGLGPGAVPAIAERVSRWLALPAGERRPAREALRATAARRWGWEGVARAVLAASAGRLEGLPAPTLPDRPLDQ